MLSNLHSVPRILGFFMSRHRLGPAACCEEWQLLQKFLPETTSINFMLQEFLAISVKGTYSLPVAQTA